MKMSNVKVENVEPIGIVNASSVYGIGILRAIFYSISSILGIQSNVMTEQTQNAINSATQSLEESAKLLKADGVMNIRYQMSYLSVMAYGTAYKETKETNEKFENQL